MLNRPLWSDPGPAGVQQLAREVGAWATSPDDRWLAFGDALPGPSGQAYLHCIEVSTGRAVISVPGGEVKALGWASPELLLVVRAQGDTHSRIVAHAVPDGGVMGSIPLDLLPGHRARMSFAREPGRASPVLLVTPWRWRASARQNVRKALGYVVRTEPLEVASVFDPDEIGALPRLYEVREALAELGPDGSKIALWYGAPAVNGVAGTMPGVLVMHDWQSRKSHRVCEAGAWVVELLWADARTIALRTAHTGMQEVARRGDLTVVDTELATVIHDSSGEDPQGAGWMGGRATMDLHPDRQHLLIGGRVVKEKSPRARRGTRNPDDDESTTAPLEWSGALRVIDLEAGLAMGRVEEVPTRVEVAMGAAWLGDDGTLCTLTGHGRRDARITVWRSVHDGPQNTSVGFLMDGRNVHAGSLAHSTGGRWLVAHWRVDPTGTTRRDVGSAYATRLAFLEIEQILRAAGL